MIPVNFCYYPTTAVFLDDYHPFLSDLKLAVSEDIAYTSFKVQEHAIEYINDNIGRNPANDPCSLSSDSECCDMDKDFAIKVNIDSIADKLCDKQRFFEPSVLVVDYDMPGINGLEVCQAVRNPYVKKILLTGVADERVAVDALNHNIIDYYIKKSSPDVFTAINSLIREYQAQYFNELSSVIRKTLKASCHFLDDPAFDDYFQSLIQENQIVEYYFKKATINNACQFTMITGSGQAYRLNIYTDQVFEQHVDIAEDVNAPEGLANTLKERTHIPDFASLDCYYDSRLNHWHKHLLTVEPIKGKKDTYYCHFAKDYRTVDIFSYQKHLIMHDA